jgi:hypothetical protein
MGGRGVVAALLSEEPDVANNPSRHLWSIAWLEYQKGRPLTLIRYDDFASKGLIDVLVDNRSEIDVIVRGARVLFDKDVKVSVGDSVHDIIFSLLGGGSKLIRSGHNCTVTFHLPDERRRRSYFALISWRRLSGLAAPTIPLVIRLPRAELESLARDS